jgi:hypothetical protein
MPYRSATPPDEQDTYTVPIRVFSDPAEDDSDGRSAAAREPKARWWKWRIRGSAARSDGGPSASDS